MTPRQKLWWGRFFPKLGLGLAGLGIICIIVYALCEFAGWIKYGHHYWVLPVLPGLVAAYFIGDLIDFALIERLKGE